MAPLATTLSSYDPTACTTAAIPLFGNSHDHGRASFTPSYHTIRTTDIVTSAFAQLAMTSAEAPSPSTPTATITISVPQETARMQQHEDTHSKEDSSGNSKTNHTNDGGSSWLALAWIPIAMWGFFIYSASSVFILIWLWSKGLIDKHMTPTHRAWGLGRTASRTTTTSYPRRYSTDRSFNSDDGSTPPRHFSASSMAAYPIYHPTYEEQTPSRPSNRSTTIDELWSRLDEDLERRRRQQQALAAEMRRLGMA